MLRSDLSELGISSRDRLTAAQRAPDARASSIASHGSSAWARSSSRSRPAVTRTRVLAQDVPWIVVPPSLVEQTEMAQMASIARAVARIAYGVPWLEELPPPHIEALLVAAARQVVPGYGADDVDVLTLKLVAQHETTLAKLLTRRQKKLLEELAPHIASPQSRPPAGGRVRQRPRAGRASDGVRRDRRPAHDGRRDAAARSDAAPRAPRRPGPQALAAVLDHAFAGDVVRYALTPEATALRRRLGSTWTWTVSLAARASSPPPPSSPALAQLEDGHLGHPRVADACVRLPVAAPAHALGVFRTRARPRDAGPRTRQRSADADGQLAVEPHVARPAGRARLAGLPRLSAAVQRRRCSPCGR